MNCECCICGGLACGTVSCVGMVGALFFAPGLVVPFGVVACVSVISSAVTAIWSHSSEPDYLPADLV